MYVYVSHVQVCVLFYILWIVTVCRSEWVCALILFICMCVFWVSIKLIRLMQKSLHSHVILHQNISATNRLPLSGTKVAIIISFHTTHKGSRHLIYH